MYPSGKEHPPSIADAQSSLAVEVKVCRMPSPNVGVGAALVITVPDSCMGVRASAMIAGVEFRGWFGIIEICLGQEKAVRAEALIADAAAAKTLTIAVESITAVSGI